MAYIEKDGTRPVQVLLESHLELRVPPKILIFAWRVGHNLLPTNSKIATINPAANNLCSRCNVEEETLIHALRDCVKAQNILVQRVSVTKCFARYRPMVLISLKM